MESDVRNMIKYLLINTHFLIMENIKFTGEINKLRTRKKIVKILNYFMLKDFNMYFLLGKTMQNFLKIVVGQFFKEI